MSKDSENNLLSIDDRDFESPTEKSVSKRLLSLELKNKTLEEKLGKVSEKLFK